MSFRYALYVILLLLLSTLLFLYQELGGVEERLEKKEHELIRLKAELSRKKTLAERFKERLREENIEPLSEREALERLFGFIDELKTSYDLRVTKDIRKEGNSWVVNLKLSLEPSDSKELVRKLKRLMGKNSPIVFIERVAVVAEPLPTVEIDVSLKQPFMENRNEVDSV